MVAGTRKWIKRDRRGLEPPAQLEYFGSDQFVGDEAVVSSVVTGVLGGKSLVLDGSEYGDESLLAITGRRPTWKG